MYIIALDNISSILSALMRWVRIIETHLIMMQSNTTPAPVSVNTAVVTGGHQQGEHRDHELWSTPSKAPSADFYTLCSLILKGRGRRTGPSCE